MTQFSARCSVGMVELSALVIRGSGYREDLGRIAFWDRRLLTRLVWSWRRGRNNNLFIVTEPIAGLITLLVPFAAAFLTQAGIAVTSNRLRAGGTEPLNIGWGIGSGTTSRGDTILFTEVFTDLVSITGARTVGVSSQVTTTNPNDTYQVVGTRVATGNGSVTNAGLFDNGSLGGGNLYMKGDFPAIGLNTNDSITFTAKVQYTD